MTKRNAIMGPQVGSDRLAFSTSQEREKPSAFSPTCPVGHRAKDVTDRALQPSSEATAVGCSQQVGSTGDMILCIV